MKKIENKKIFLPNLFTMLNMFCGFFAIIEIFQKNYVIGAWLLIIASIFDALDGKIARSLNTLSKFGTEFDSLADLVSFGIGPSILVYAVYFNQLGNLGILLSFIPLSCGAFRLARFNITPVSLKKEMYLGLPIPLYAITVASFVIINYEYWDAMKLNNLFIPIILLLSILLVSHVKYDKLPKFKIIKNKNNDTKFIIALLYFGIALLFKGKAIFLLMMVLIFHGIIRWIFNLFKNNNDSEVADASIYE